MIAVDLLVPLGICVALPVMVVWLAFRYLINKDNRRTELMMEAIKINPNIETSKLLESLKKPEYTLKERIIRKLLRGSIFSLIGMVFIIIGIVMACIMETIRGNEDIVVNIFVIGGVCLAVGIGFLIAWSASKKQLKEEIEKTETGQS